MSHDANDVQQTIQIQHGTVDRPARILKYDTTTTRRYCAACDQNTEHRVTTVRTITGRSPRDIVRCLEPTCPESIEHT